MDTQNKVETLKPDAVITIKFGPDFYQRLVIILRSIIEEKSPEEMEKAAKQIETKVIEEEWVLNYETMLHMVKACEDYAKANNMTEWKEKESIQPSVENAPKVSS